MHPHFQFGSLFFELTVTFHLQL
uniref:Uncharacterized protein n=1 Tax=Rhizophora mucronata TaxID=61149 RepID=A0A2P2M143_RHIMU